MTMHFRIADDVAWVSQDDLDGGDVPVAYMTRVPGGPPILLEGSGCIVWLALAEGGTLEDITVRAAELSDTDADLIRDDVADLVDQLVVIRLADEEDR
ncbi:PqqD family protein [Nocardioides hwasunensis]|uniref:PqqD family protein n=1 Tax=Nocardioides hwasunensis TaxID=397258 RepID=A0ABR8MLX3_9ACTN|nr:PqqD family protein [Nocardioides hwasunensis]MBD3917027.1 PqqD family protein [Nocardioides hwasunensis]